MDPISLSLAAVGFGMQLFGGMGQAHVAGQIAQVSQDKAQEEGQINSLKQQQVRLEASRTQMQNIRNMQQSRAMASASATAQGAQFGSGIQGGLANVTSQGLFNMVGVNSALQTSEGIYGHNQKITQDNSQIASLGGQSATDAGYASIGGALMKAAPGLGSIFGGGNSSGYGGLASGNAFNNSNSRSSYYGPLN